MDYEEFKKLKVGDIVKVRAWWLKDRMIRAEVRNITDFTKTMYIGDYHYCSIDVKPLEGNPHMRSVPIDMIESAQ